jgi:hypothetical protein
LTSTFVCTISNLTRYAFSIYYGKYKNGYAWTVSASFLEGKLPALIVLSLLLVYLALITYIKRKDFHFQKKINFNASTKDNGSILSTFLTSIGYLQRRIHIKFCVAVFVNCGLIIIINIIYISINLRANQSSITATQISFGVFKIFWNSFVTPLMYEFSTTHNVNTNKFMEAFFITL